MLKNNRLEKIKHVRDVTIATINIVKEIGSKIPEYTHNYIEREESSDSIPQQKSKTSHIFIMLNKAMI